MAEELVTFYLSGALPGIPGEHAPGTYLVDYEARTIRPAADSRSILDTTEEIPSEEVSDGAPLPEEAIPEVVPVPDVPQEMATPEQRSENGEGA